MSEAYVMNVFQQEIISLLNSIMAVHLASFIRGFWSGQNPRLHIRRKPRDLIAPATPK